MKSTGGTDEAKRRAGESAADRVTDGAVVGLGTGSTTAYAIRALGRAIESGLDVRGVPTSYQSRSLAREVGIPLVTLEDAIPDIAIDGADQIAGRVLVKGGGAAHAREKVVDASAEHFVVVADETKVVDVLESPIPMEVLPDAVPTVERAVHERGGEPVLRLAQRKDGPVVTDNGNLVLDCDFGKIDDPASLAVELSAVPGVVEHGLFVGLADELHVGSDDDVTVTRL